MKIMMDKMCFKQTTQEITISPHIIICPWRIYCITTLASLKEQIIMFWQIQSKPVYILFNNKSQNCFVDNRCITRRLKKSNHWGTKPNGSPFFFYEIVKWNRSMLFNFQISISIFAKEHLLKRSKTLMNNCFMILPHSQECD